MRKLSVLGFLALFSALTFGQGAPPLLFQGFGSSAQVGATIVNVTNTSTSGAGSLAACVAQSNVHCKFTVSGTISNPNIFVTGNIVTIDGFSAPSPGITLTGGPSNGGPLNINNVHDVIVQGIKFRNCNGTTNVKCILVGDLPVTYPSGCNSSGCTTPGVVATRTYNIVLDHDEFLNASDEVVDIATVKDMTISWSLISNVGGDSGCQFTGYGSYHVSTHHNLFVNCNDGADTRTPLIAGGWSCCFANTGSFDPGQTADVEWNVTANWQTFGFYAASDGEMRMWGNFIGNYQWDSDSDHARNAMQFPGLSSTLWYLAGNANMTSPIVPVGAPTPYYSGPNDESFGPAPNPFCNASSNKLDCTKVTTFPSGSAVCTASGIAVNSCQSATTLGTFTTPVSGPCAFDNPSRITEWTNVINTAGVQPVFADDTTSAALRTTAKQHLPTTTILNQTWNTQSGGTCIPAAAAPVFSPTPGSFATAQTVSISSTSTGGGAIICYSTTTTPSINGGSSCVAGTLYTAPITISSNTTLRAVAGGTAFSDSPLTTGAYIINVNNPLSPSSLNVTNITTLFGLNPAINTNINTAFVPVFVYNTGQGPVSFAYHGVRQ